MKLIDKMANGIEVLAPIIILFFACAAYLRYTENEKFHTEEFRKELRQEIEKHKAGNAPDSFLPFRD
jgi:arginine utilization protein RocB